MPNVIRSIATDDEFGTQSIRMIVTSNERGAQGPQGEPGEAATIAAGQAYSVEPGQSPAVMNTGTSSAAVFDFYIPKGEKGDQGDPGPAGADEWGEITGNIADQTDLQNALNGKQNKLTAGSNITISGDTISATDTTYIAGNGLNLNHGEFSVNTGTIQEKLTAGTNVDITGNTISATDTTYTAGTGLDLNGTEFSVDTDTIQSKLTAGSNIQINGSTISATDTTYTAGNAITIDSGNNNAINAAIDPADFFTSTESKLTGTGTSVTLTPTVGLPLDSVQLDGDTTQQTYSGKNLIGNLVSTGTNNGLTTVVNADGSLSVSGKSTTTYATLTAAKTVDIPNNTKVTFSVESNTSNMAFGIILYDAGYTNRQNLNIQSGSRTATFTTNSAKSIAVLWVSSLTANTNYSYTFKDIQFEISASATSFEPYVGGIPAPNPDYPQTVNTVTGRQVVTVSGKNLFDKDNINVVHKAPGSGTNVLNSGSSYYSIYIPIDSGEVYTVSWSSSNVDQYAKMFFTSEDPTTATECLSQKLRQGQSITDTAPSGASYLCVYLAYTTNQSVITDVVNTVQIEQGSTPTAYQPYQGQSYEVNLGKNLFDVSSITENTSPEFTGGEGHVVTFSANSNRAVMLIKVEPNTSYTLSIGDTSIVNQIFIVGMKNTTTESGHSFSWVTSGTTITTGSKDQYIMGAINVNNGSGGTIVNITNANVQIEKGSTATTYAAYFTPIELGKIGTYQDYIYKSSGNWYVHKACGEVEFDGTEGWYLPNSSSYPNLFQATLTGITINAGYTTGSTDLPAFCGYFTRYNSNGVRNAVGYAFYNDGANVVARLNNNNYTTTTAFDNWLQSTDVSIYYVLATPTDTQITNADLVAQLNALVGATTYDGQTVITVTSDNQLAILDVGAYRKSLAGIISAIKEL